jgi:hypothetical protein
MSSSPGRRQNGEFKSKLKRWGFSSLTPVCRYEPKDSEGNTATVAHYRHQCRIMGRVPTPLGDTQLSAEQRQPAPHTWLFNGAVKGEGNNNVRVRVLLVTQQGVNFGYIQEVSQVEGIKPDTGEITFANE